LVDSGVQDFVFSKDPLPSDLAEKIAMLIGEENLEKMCNKAQEVALQYR
jgi:hypothetical protein